MVQPRTRPSPPPAQAAALWPPRLEGLLPWTALLCGALLLLSACTESGLTEACPPHATRCGGSCVDTVSHPLHCGGCNVACGEEERCSEGACTALCPPDRTFCDDACVSLHRDPAHCGACGARCPEGQVCSSGTCREDCESGLSDCDGACVDLRTDGENCGACGSVCLEGEACREGACHCPEGFTDCGGSCVDTRADVVHCGGCGKSCDEDFVCDAGRCVCPEGEIACEGRCVDPQRDAANCGGCGLACEKGMVCAGGACGCPEGQERCESGCVDTSSRVDDCGACGNVCWAHGGVAGAYCDAGACVYECKPGFLDCDPDLPGCETDGQTSNQHCGACDSPCVGDESCSNGTCCPLEETGCGGACVRTAEDDENCGACGNDCATKPRTEGGACVDGTCAFVCVDGYADCNGEDADGCEAHLPSDPMHCGACGKRCPVGCVNGKCTSSSSVTLGYFHACMIRETDGSVWCWGQNQHGQLGNGEKVPLPHIESVPVRAGELTDIIQVDANDRATCALRVDGTVWCWGQGGNGILGNGSFDDSQVPVQVLDLDDAVQIAVASATACAVRKDTTVACWGWNIGGLLGDGNDKNIRNVIGPVMEDFETETILKGVVQVAMTRESACARLKNGTVKCWGEGSRGEMGNGTSGNDHNFNPKPGLVMIDEKTPLTGVVHLAGRSMEGGARAHLALRIDGSAYAWGRNEWGVLGLGHTTNEVYPYATRTLLEKATQASIGFSRACARIEDGSVRCWGNSGGGALGNPSINISTGTPTPVLGEGCEGTLSKVTAVASGGSASCALLEDGSLRCFGRNTHGLLGSYPEEAAPCPVPAP